MAVYQLLLWVLLGLVLLPLGLRLLRRVIPVFRRHVGQCAAKWTTDAARRGFEQAAVLITDGGRLSPPQAVSQTMGALFLVVAGVVFAVCDLQFTFATLGPLFGLQVNLTDGLFGRFDQLLGFSLVLLAVVFGLILTDLLGWSAVTRFTRIERARLGAFLLASMCFAATIGVAAALAAYRLPALMLEQASIQDTMFWLENMPPVILLGLAVLLLIGIAFTMMAFETFSNALVSLLLALHGVVFGVVSIVLRIIDCITEIILASVGMLIEDSVSSKEKAHSASARAQKGLKRIGQGVYASLLYLVHQKSTGLDQQEQVPSTHNVHKLGPRPLKKQHADGPAQSEEHGLGIEQEAEPRNSGRS